MMFVGQFPIPDERSRLAYLFVTDDPDCTAETFAPEAGENALLIQPGGRIPPFVATTDGATGPSLWRRGLTWNDRVAVEFAMDLRASSFLISADFHAANWPSFWVGRGGQAYS